MADINGIQKQWILRDQQLKADKLIKWLNLCTIVPIHMIFIRIATFKSK